MVRLAFALLAILGIGLSSESRGEETISTAEIIARSVSEDCLEWKISGVCIWLKCSIFGCRIVTTPRISHRLPDLVVAAYPEPNHSPWQDAARIIASMQIDSKEALSGGSVSGIGASRLLHDELKYFESDVIGSPVVRLPGVRRFLCRSASQPFFPYFVSLRDAIAWRSGMPDAKRSEALERGVREIGLWPEFTWGSVYPRSGFVMQAHAGKAAAVSSQRAVDIVLRDSTGHVTGKFSANPEQRVTRGDVKAENPRLCHLSGGRWQRTPRLNEEGRCVRQVWHQWLPSANEQSDRWQMLLPHHARRCETFGAQPEWPHPEISESGRYLWNYWAKYKCCVKAGGVLLKAFDF